MIFTAILDKQMYHSGIGRLKGKLVRSGDVTVGHVSDVDTNVLGNRVIAKLFVQDHFVERAANKGLKVTFTMTGGLNGNSAAHIVLTPVDVQKQVYEQAGGPAITHVSHNNPAFSNGPLYVAASGMIDKSPLQFHQEYLNEFVPEPPPPLVLCWEKAHCPDPGLTFECWPSNDKERIFYGASKLQAVNRALGVLRAEDAELWKDPQIIRGRDFEQNAKMVAKMSSEPVKNSGQLGWVDAPISGPGKAKYIIVEPQEVRPRADDDPDPRKPWVCRPEGQTFPVAEGDTPEEAVELLKLLNESLEPLDFVVVGGKKSSSGPRAAAGPRVERSLEV